MAEKEIDLVEELLEGGVSLLTLPREPCSFRPYDQSRVSVGKLRGIIRAHGFLGAVFNVDSENEANQLKEFFSTHFPNYDTCYSHRNEHQVGFREGERE